MFIIPPVPLETLKYANCLIGTILAPTALLELDNIQKPYAGVRSIDRSTKLFEDKSRSGFRAAPLFLNTMANMEKSTSITFEQSADRRKMSTRSRRFNAEKSEKMEFDAEKSKYLNMSKEEKRALCDKKVISFEEIPTWPEYWRQNQANIPPVSGTNKADKSFSEKISIWHGDITTLEIDTIVNAANKTLLGGGGVDGAIHKAAGPTLRAECKTLNGCEVGEAKITGGYKLPAKYIIHTVGPQGEKPAELSNCYSNCLRMAVKENLKSIAFPCISTGVYGYPQKPAAAVAIATVKKFLMENKDKIERIVFCLFLDSDKQIYEEILQKMFSTE